MESGRRQELLDRIRRSAVSVWRGGQEIELMHRAMAFAALGFVTLIPLLIVVADAAPARSSGITDWLVEGMALSGRSAHSVADLFSSPHKVLSTTTGLSLAAVAVFGLSFVSALQNGYERIWGLQPSAWHAVWRHVVGLVGVVGYLLGASWSRVPGRSTALQPGFAVSVTLVGGLLLFWWLQRLLVAGRRSWAELFPGSLATVLAQFGLWLFSRLVFGPQIVSNAVSYGTIGTVLVVQSWLIGVGFTVYAGPLVGRAVRDPDFHPIRRPD